MDKKNELWFDFYKNIALLSLVSIFGVAGYLGTHEITAWAVGSSAMAVIFLSGIFSYCIKKMNFHAEGEKC